MKFIKKHKVIILFLSLTTIFLILFNIYTSSISCDYITKISTELKMPDNESWFVITSEEQRQNWINQGMDLPVLDFNENFMIVSKYKIFSLFKTSMNCEDSGVPYGIAFNNYLTGKDNNYYIYKMEKVWVDQAVG